MFAALAQPLQLALAWTWEVQILFDRIKDDYTDQIIEATRPGSSNVAKWRLFVLPKVRAHLLLIAVDHVYGIIASLSDSEQLRNDFGSDPFLMQAALLCDIYDAEADLTGPHDLPALRAQYAQMSTADPLSMVFADGDPWSGSTDIHWSLGGLDVLALKEVVDRLQTALMSEPDPESAP